jgi:hypothetical protein
MADASLPLEGLIEQAGRVSSTKPSGKKKGTVKQELDTGGKKKAASQSWSEAGADTHGLRHTNRL